MYKNQGSETPAPATSKWGRNGEERAALLGVRTGPKALRAVGGSFSKLWESKEKLTGWNTPPVVCKTRGLRNAREELAIPAGGRRQGGGERGKLSPREATRSHTANRPPVPI